MHFHVKVPTRQVHATLPCMLSISRCASEPQQACAVSVSHVPLFRSWPLCSVVYMCVDAWACMSHMCPCTGVGHPSLPRHLFRSVHTHHRGHGRPETRTGTCGADHCNHQPDIAHCSTGTEPCVCVFVCVCVCVCVTVGSNADKASLITPRLYSPLTSCSCLLPSMCVRVCVCVSLHVLHAFKIAHNHACVLTKVVVVVVRVSQVLHAASTVARNQDIAFMIALLWTAVNLLMSGFFIAYNQVGVAIRWYTGTHGHRTRHVNIHGRMHRYHARSTYMHNQARSCSYCNMQVP